MNKEQLRKIIQEELLRETTLFDTQFTRGIQQALDSKNYNAIQSFIDKNEGMGKEEAFEILSQMLLDQLKNTVK